MAGTAPGPAFLGRLFPSSGSPRDVAITELQHLDIADDQVLWIDLEAANTALLAAVWSACDLPEAASAFLHGGTTPAVCQDADFFWVRCVAVDATSDSTSLCGNVLTCIAGPNRVVSIHDDRIGFISDLREGKHGHAPVGNLCSESFVAVLLDRLLATYFEAVSDYEMAIERLEVDILAARNPHSLPELQRLRRWASRLRRMLAPHRSVFGVMSRPDFRPTESHTAERHFVALDTRFERAMDMVENARDLVLGSFELFSNQTALQTNETMRVLTFVTVITGLLATLVGALGMNFDAGFFKSQDAGFWWAIAGLAALTCASVAIGRWRRWF